jgi:hypothetical protein
MQPEVECTHCGVVMTSWSVPASPIRYYQCPFCQRTHSSHYGEVFRSHAGARVMASRPRVAAPAEFPMASPEDVRWAGIKSAANRWYARLDADERRNAARPQAGSARRAPIPLTVAVDSPAPDPLAGLEVSVELDPPAAAPAPAPIPLRVAVGARRR